MILALLSCAIPPVTTAVAVAPKEVDVAMVCINELMADNETALTDATGATPDWVELKNVGATEVSLASWEMGDDRNDTKPLDDTLTIPAGGSLVLLADDQPELGPLHLPFSLSADGGEVVLVAPNQKGSVVTYGFMSDDFSVARTTDCCAGAGCWGHVWRGTPGRANL